jgi:hypothetical protein
MSLNRSSSVMLFFLVVLVLLYHIGIGFYSAHGLEPLPLFTFLYTAGLLCSVIWWLRADARRYKVQPVYCLGMLVSVGWVVVIPYHLWATRGARGLLLILALIGAFVVAQFVAVFTYLLFAGWSAG